MRAPTAVGLFFAAHLLALAPPVLAAPQNKHAPTKKPAADTLAKDIIGTWKADIPTGNGGEPVHMRVTFKKDGTATQHIEGSGHKLDQWMKYHVAHGWLIQTLVRAKDNGNPYSPPNPGTHKMKAKIEGNKLSVDVYEGRSEQIVLHRMTS